MFYLSNKLAFCAHHHLHSRPLHHAALHLGSSELATSVVQKPHLFPFYRLSIDSQAGELLCESCCPGCFEGPPWPQFGVYGLRAD